MKLSEVKKKYKNQWVLVEVLKEDPETLEPDEVKVVEHSKSRADTYEVMEKLPKEKYLYHFYNGKISDKYAFMFIAAFSPSLQFSFLSR